MGQFLYLVNRETLTLRIFVVMSLYCLSLVIPVWWLALPVNPVTNAWDIFPFIDSLKGILTSGRIVWWVVHGIIAAYFTSVYFDTMSYAYAFLLPLYAPFFWWCFLYAKTFGADTAATLPSSICLRCFHGLWRVPPLPLLIPCCPWKARNQKWKRTKKRSTRTRRRKRRKSKNGRTQRAKKRVLFHLQKSQSSDAESRRQ